MSVFEVEARDFEDRVEFNHYLTENYSVGADGDLYIIAGMTEYPWPKFRELLSNAGYEILDTYGSIHKMAREYGSDGRIEFYLSFDEEEKIALFYTNMRKTEEIENTIEIFLNNTPRVHYLYISPRVMQNIREKIADEEPSTQVVNFVASRTTRSEIPARIRPRFSRTITYFGADGLEAMREMEENYGVVPRMMEFKIPNISRFKISREGVFNLQNGDLRILFEHIQTCIERALELKRAYGEAKFEMVTASDNLSVPTSQPASISLRNNLEYHEIDDFKENMAENNYVLIDTFAEEGSLFFSSKVIDQQKKNSFRVKANQDEIRVYPQEDRDIGSFLRFYEFIQDTIDEDASLEVPA